MNRRKFLESAGGFALFCSLPGWPSWAQSSTLIKKKISSTGELIPAIGMGTWITFNVGNSEAQRNRRSEVAKAFFDAGGTVIDSSPMYGSSEAVVGYALKKLGSKKAFSATKVWTSNDAEAKKQFEDSLRLWGLPKLDLYQIHNLDGWQSNLKMTNELKAKGLIKYTGLTTSHGRRHDEMASIMKAHAIDFIQVTYNLDHTEAEELLKLAQEKKIAVLINRPFDGGDLFAKVKGKSVPSWCKEIGVETWAQFFLKFVISHSAVTCAIPATSKVEHMKDNMAAARGILPDAKMREKMLAAWKAF